MGITVDIRPTGVESAIVYAPFDEALAELQKHGHKLISLPQNALLRIQHGKDAYISQNGNWTREGILYTPGEGNKLVRVSPIFESAKKAVQAHRNGEEFYPTRKQIEQSLEDSIDFPEEEIGIPTNRFGSEALTVYAFGGEIEARAYGKFLRESGIKEMPVYAVGKDYVNKQSQPFARQLWFWHLDAKSGLSGCGRNLDGNCRVRGVKVSTEATSLKKSKK